MNVKEEKTIVSIDLEQVGFPQQLPKELKNKYRIGGFSIIDKNEDWIYLMPNLKRVWLQNYFEEKAKDKQEKFKPYIEFFVKSIKITMPYNGEKFIGKYKPDTEMFNKLNTATGKNCDVEKLKQLGNFFSTEIANLYSEKIARKEDFEKIEQFLN